MFGQRRKTPQVTEHNRDFSFFTSKLEAVRGAQKLLNHLFGHIPAKGIPDKIPLPKSFHHGVKCLCQPADFVTAFHFQGIMVGILLSNLNRRVGQVNHWLGDLLDYNQ